MHSPAIFSAEAMLHRSDQAGFSLIELMVTLSIAAILLAIGVPNMTDLIRDARLSSQSELLVTSLNLARTEAVTQRSNFKVCPSATPNTDTSVLCDAGVSAWSKGWMTINGTNFTQRAVASSELTVTTTATSVEFSGTIGNATATSSFVLCTPKRKQHVVDITMSGYISKRIGTTVCP